MENLTLKRVSSSMHMNPNLPKHLRNLIKLHGYQCKKILKVRHSIIPQIIKIPKIIKKKIRAHSKQVKQPKEGANSIKKSQNCLKFDLMKQTVCSFFARPLIILAAFGPGIKTESLKFGCNIFAII